MWSDRHYYLNICRDIQLSESFSSAKLLSFLRSIPELKQVNDFEFRNTDTFPYVELLILKAKSFDSWSSRDTNSEETNLVTIVCSKTNQEDFEKVKAILIQLASFLNWPLIDERTDDGEENKIWP